jgi:adenine phosphoribosyltransferase
MSSFDFEGHITDIVDYPKPGVVFKDITTLLKDPDGFEATIDAIAEYFKDAGVTKVVGAEARGFMIGAPVAYRLHAGFVPARKPGKLPREVRSESYDLEYGSDELQIHADAIEPDDVVLIVDDLVATGGTAEAQAKLIKQFGASLAGMGFLMELAFLNPRQAIAKVTDAEVFSLVQVH